MTDFVYVNTPDIQSRVANRIAKLDRPFRVEVKKGKRRSLEQNAYLFGLCYPFILKQSGLDEQRWEKDDLHEYFMGEFYGWKELKGFGRTRLKRMTHSSEMNKQEFSDFLELLKRECAQRYGIAIPDPELDVKLDES